MVQSYVVSSSMVQPLEEQLVDYISRELGCSEYLTTNCQVIEYVQEIALVSASYKKPSVLLKAQKVILEERDISV